MKAELDDFIKAFAEAGGDALVLSDASTGHLAADGARILSMREIEGLDVKAQETPTGINAVITLKKGVRLLKPVHMCFSVLHEKGTQEIKMDIRLEKDSSAHFMAHCIFPKPVKVTHRMEADIRVGEGAEMRYSEAHYHGPGGGIKVIPKAKVNIERNGKYFTDFSLISGMVGILDIDYSVTAGEDAVAELTARVFGHGNGRIIIKEEVLLAGERARGLIKTRVAIEDSATAEVTGVTEGGASGARGHVDCMEIVKDRAVAKAIPIVYVTHPLAKVTHEAAIGTVDKKQLETLMAHGLAPEEAVDVIVKGVLRKQTNQQPDQTKRRES